MDARISPGAAVRAAARSALSARSSSARSTSGRTEEGRLALAASSRSIPVGAAEVFEGGCVKAPAQSLERGLLGVDLGAARRGHGAALAFDDAVLDVYIGRTYGKPETVRNDMTVRDVKLASVERRQAVAFELDVASVDLDQAIALADHRIVAPLHRRARR